MYQFTYPGLLNREDVWGVLGPSGALAPVIATHIAHTAPQSYITTLVYYLSLQPCILGWLSTEKGEVHDYVHEGDR